MTRWAPTLLARMEPLATALPFGPPACDRSTSWVNSMAGIPRQIRFRPCPRVVYGAVSCLVSARESYTSSFSRRCLASCSIRPIPTPSPRSSRRAPPRSRRWIPHMPGATRSGSPTAPRTATCMSPSTSMRCISVAGSAMATNPRASPVKTVPGLAQWTSSPPSAVPTTPMTTWPPNSCPTSRRWATPTSSSSP